MTPKKKDSPELFEVFRSAVRDRERGSDEPEAVTEAERAALGAEVAEEAAPVTPRFVPRPAPAPTPESGMGERRLSLKYNSVVLSLMLCVGLVFVAFAMGVRWEEGRGKQAAPRVAQDPRLQGQLETLAQPPTPPGVPPNDSRESYVPPPQDPPSQGTEIPPPTAPPRAVGKYWIRLIHFDAANSDSEALVRMHLKNLTEKGFDQACERRLQDSHGTKFVAVCFGPFQTKAQAEECLPKLQAAQRHHEYKQADVICDE